MPAAHWGAGEDARELLGMHQIRFVDDSALPDGHDFMLVEHGGGMTVFCRRIESERMIEDMWAAYRAAAARPTPRTRLRCVS